MLGAMVLFCGNAVAQSVIVKDAWTRATAPGQTTAGVYLEIVSSTDAALVSVKSAIARSAEIHAMRMEDGVMKMRGVERLALPAGKAVRLEPGGLHIMLLGVTRPLRENETIPLELEIEAVGGSGVSKLATRVEVRAQTAHPHSHSHAH